MLALSSGPYVKSQNMGVMTGTSPSYPAAANRQRCDCYLVTALQTMPHKLLHHLTIILITVTEVGHWVACPLRMQPPVWH